LRLEFRGSSRVLNTGCQSPTPRCDTNAFLPSPSPCLPRILTSLRLIEFTRQTMPSKSVPFFLQSLPSPLPPIPATKAVAESVANITDRAHRRIAQTFNKTASLRTFLLSYEKTVLYQGAIYVSEGDYVQGYLYLYMFAEYSPQNSYIFIPSYSVLAFILFVDHDVNKRFTITWIKQHPDWKQPQHQAQIKHVQEVPPSRPNHSNSGSYVPPSSSAYSKN
jgi:hypothetical protein